MVYIKSIINFGPSIFHSYHTTYEKEELDHTILVNLKSKKEIIQIGKYPLVIIVIIVGTLAAVLELQH